MAAPGKEFEQRVADVYSALGYQVVQNTQLPGRQTDIFAERFTPGGPPIRLVIECKDEAEPVDNTETFKFITKTIAHRDSKRVDFGVLVSAGGFTHPARAAAEEHPFILLLSWEELNADLVDVRHPLRKLVTDYEASAIGRHYLPLASEKLSWASLAPEGSPQTLEDVLERWKSPPGSDPGAPSSLFVLGDFGAGKTTLLHHLQYDRGKAYLAQEDTRIPLFVPLRNFPEIGDMGALLKASFRESYARELTTALLWQYLREGRFHLLLDGFDEMVERSDVDRRLELFYRLVPLLQTHSHAIVTSRPGYFVERGELEGLLARLDAQRSSPSSSTPPVEGDSRLPAGLLQRKLVAHYRETQPGLGGEGTAVPPYSTEVFRLPPLSRKRIEAFLDRYAGELEEVGSSPEALMTFIAKTYDLWDLASRPLLLDMIVRSVLMKDLDPSETEVQYGASGLYEIYTGSALQVDLYKGRTRQEGLPTEVRRMLAEALAVHLYEEGVLAVDFHEVLEKILPRNEQLTRALEKSDFSTREIETDFATCSFVTLERGGSCRFIHKSFRGFFVARVLKAHLERDHRLFDEWLDKETLYFLGGFAPTDRAVGQALWSRFQRSADPTRRRNMLVAFLHTQPIHTSKRIDTAEVADADFGRLSFRRSRIKDVMWRRCAIRKLELDHVKWDSVGLDSSRITHLHANESDLDLEALDTTFETVEMTKVKSARFRCDASTIGALRLSEASLDLSGRDIQIDRFEGKRCAFSTLDSREIRMGEVDVDQSRIRLDPGWAFKRLKASRTVLGMSLEGLDKCRLDLEECVMRISPKPTPPAILKSRGFPLRDKTSFPLRDKTRVDPHSVILSVGDVAGSLLDIGPCGLFGAVGDGAPEFDLGPLPKVWGVVDLGDSIPRELKELDPDIKGVRHGNLLLVRGAWYEREAFPGGRLASVDRLHRFAVKSAVDESFASWDLLPSLLAAVKAEFDQVMADDWAPLRR